jgi:hypothetical protein
LDAVVAAGIASGTMARIAVSELAAELTDGEVATWGVA